MRTAITGLLFVAFLLTGCQTGQVTAAKSLAVIGYTVDSAMKLYADANARGLIKPEQRAKITQLHDQKFAPVYRTAITTAKLDYTKATPEDVSKIAFELIALINNVVNPNQPQLIQLPYILLII